MRRWRLRLVLAILAGCLLAVVAVVFDASGLDAASFRIGDGRAG